MQRKSTVLAYLALLAGCASNPTGQLLSPAPSGPPIVHVVSTEIDTVLFLGVTFRIVGVTLGAHHEGLLKVRQYSIRGTPALKATYESWSREIGNAMLESAGYPVRHTSRLFAQLEDYSGVRYALAGAVNEISLDTYGMFAGDKTEASVNIQWELLDTSTRDVMFAQTTTGQAATGGNTGDAVRVALERAFRQLLARPDLADAMRSPTTLAEMPAAQASNSNWTHPVPSEGALIRLTGRGLNPVAEGSLFERSAPAVLSITGSNGSGTAFIVTMDGLALTNHHVIEGQTELVAINQAGDTLPVRLVRDDASADVSLLQVSCPLPCSTIPLANDVPAVGEGVLVIGTPLSSALAYSATKGIISGLRRIDGVVYVQTDAALNSGNSGGPIVASDGTVVGIVTWKVMDESVEGVGFGIEIGDALNRLGVRR